MIFIFYLEKGVWGGRKLTRDTVGKLTSMLRAMKKKKKTRKRGWELLTIRRQVAVLISVVREGSLEKVTM